MCYLLQLTMCIPSKTKQKYREHNKSSEKQTKQENKDINSIKIITNQVRNKQSKNVETTIKLTSDKINQNYQNSG